VSGSVSVGLSWFVFGWLTVVRVAVGGVPVELETPLLSFRASDYF
jgi:hypothetical protein